MLGLALVLVVINLENPQQGRAVCISLGRCLNDRMQYWSSFWRWQDYALIQSLTQSLIVLRVSNIHPSHIAFRSVTTIDTNSQKNVSLAPIKIQQIKRQESHTSLRFESLKNHEIFSPDFMNLCIYKRGTYEKTTPLEML